MSLQDLVKEAEKVYHKREMDEERRERERKKEAEEREDRRDRKGEKNLNRILATVVGEREMRGTERENRQGTWATQGREDPKVLKPHDHFWQKISVHTVKRRDTGLEIVLRRG